VETKRTSIAGVDVEYAVISYFRLKDIAWSAFASHPLTGVGLDQFHSRTEAAYVDGRLPNIYRTTDPHSTFLGRMAETGLAGTLPLIALWMGIIITARQLLARHADHGVALALFAALCGMLVDTVNADVMNFRFLWVAVALLRAVSEPAPTESAVDARR
jgi:O-antigen ligase